MNAEADKQKKDKIEALNQADSTIYQTEIYPPIKQKHSLQNINTTSYYHYFKHSISLLTSRPRRRGPERGDDIKQTVNISFEEAAFGKKASIKVNRSEECNECHGSGAKPGIDTCRYIYFYGFYLSNASLT